MLKTDEIFIGARYEIRTEDGRWVATVVGINNTHLRYSRNDKSTLQHRTTIADFAAMGVRRVYPCTVYLPGVDGVGVLENQLLVAPASELRDEDKPIARIPEHDGKEQMMKNVKWLTDHFYTLQRLLGLKLKGGWVTTVGDVMRELHARHAPVSEEDIPQALRALMEKTDTKAEDWTATEGPSSGAGEDYYYTRPVAQEVWWVCIDQGVVDDIALMPTEE